MKICLTVKHYDITSLTVDGLVQSKIHCSIVAALLKFGSQQGNFISLERCFNNEDTI